MSSFPKHKENIKALDAMGFDVSEAIENGEVTLESWGYDELTDTLAEAIKELQAAREEAKELYEIAAKAGLLP